MNLGRLAVTAVMAAMLAWPDLGQAGGRALEFWTGDPPRLVHSLDIAPGAVIMLDHVNSIYDAPVRETYLVESDGHLTQVAMESPSAAVLEYHGYDPPPSGRVRLERRLAEIRLLSAGYADHALTIGSTRLELESLVEAGRPITIRATNVSSGSPSQCP